MTSPTSSTPATTPVTLADTVAVTTNHGTLTSALAILKATQSNRVPVPILAAVRFDVIDGDVHASAYDYDTLTSVRIGPALPGDGVVPLFINRAALTDTVASLVKGSTKAKTAGLPVIVKGTDVSATVAADGYTFTLPALPAKDAPPTDALRAATGKSVTVDRDAFAAAVTRASASAGKDDTLPMLTGYKLTVADGVLSVVTTDRFRLGVATVAAEGESIDALAARNLPAIVKHLPSGPVTITELRRAPSSTGTPGDVQHIRYHAGDVTIVGAVIETEFVRWASLIPTDTDQTVTIDTAKLATAVTRVATVSDRGRYVKLTIHDDTVTVSCDGDGSTATSPALPIVSTVDGPFVIAFNPAFLIDALKLFGPSVSFSVRTPGKPALFADTVDALTEPSAFRHLVMPARLPS